MDIKKFRGLNNVSDALRLDKGWLVQADNVNITDSGAVLKREGYTRINSDAILGMFSTFDYQRGYLVTATQMKTFEGLVIGTLTSRAPMSWCELNDHVYFTNGTDSGVILPDHSIIPWAWTSPTPPAVSAGTGALAPGLYQVRCTYILADGRETGTSEAAEIVLTEGSSLIISGIPRLAGTQTNVYIAPANSEVFQLFATTTGTALTFNGTPDDLGRDLVNAFLDPLPPGCSYIQAWLGRIYAAQYSPEDNQTVIWFTEPLGYHLFNLNSNFFIVPGQVTMLAPHDEGLIIGTDSRVFQYAENKLQVAAEYGVPPGQHWARHDNHVIFWSKRGVCRAWPFQNLTVDSVSVAPGVKAGGCMVRDGGQQRYLSVIQQGGSAFNPYP